MHGMSVWIAAMRKNVYMLVLVLEGYQYNMFTITNNFCFYTKLLMILVEFPQVILRHIFQSLYKRTTFHCNIIYFTFRCFVWCE